MLFAFGRSVAWAHRAVTGFNGCPFPGLWGVLGFNIGPDEDGTHEEEATQSESCVDLRWFNRSPPSTVSTPLTESTPGPERGNLQVTGRRSRKCGSMTGGASSKFCRVCGVPLVG